MILFIFYLALFLAGTIGAAFLVARRFIAVKSLSAEEKENELAGLPLFFDFLREMVYEPSLEFWAGTVKPALLRAGEKTTRRSRLLTLKAERTLHRLSENLRGKRIAIENGETTNGNGKNAEFWNEINEFKKELQNGNGNGKEKKTKDR